MEVQGSKPAGPLPRTRAMSDVACQLSSSTHSLALRSDLQGMGLAKSDNVEPVRHFDAARQLGSMGCTIT